MVADSIRDAFPHWLNEEDVTIPIGAWKDVAEPPNMSRDKRLTEGEYTFVLEPSKKMANAYIIDSHGRKYDASKYIHTSLLADMAKYESAPNNHDEASKMGGKWQKAELGELSNHARNISWIPQFSPVKSRVIAVYISLCGYTK